MKSKEVVKQIMQNKHMTVAELARQMNSSRSTMWDRLNSPKKNDLSVTMLVKLLDALDYKLIIMRKDQDKPDASYTIE